MTFWQAFSILIDILFAAFYMAKIEKNNYKLSWNYLFFAFWAGFFFHEIGCF